MANIRITASAERDIASAFEWYEGQREDLGYRFMTRVDEAMELISENPRMFAPMIGPTARRVLVDQFPYAIWFVERDYDILVIGCLHHKRDMKLAMSRVDKPELK
jgi:toxin ParE1/3/4